MKSKILPEITEEDAIELAEAATGIKGRWYLGGISNKGEQNQYLLLIDPLHEREFKIHTHLRMFTYTDVEFDVDLEYYAIELVDKLRELGYELKEE